MDSSKSIATYLRSFLPAPSSSNHYYARDGPVDASRMQDLMRQTDEEYDRILKLYPHFDPAGILNLSARDMWGFPLRRRYESQITDTFGRILPIRTVRRLLEAKSLAKACGLPYPFVVENRQTKAMELVDGTPIRTEAGEQIFMCGVGKDKYLCNKDAVKLQVEPIAELAMKEIMRYQIRAIGNGFIKDGEMAGKSMELLDDMLQRTVARVYGLHSSPGMDYCKEGTYHGLFDEFGGPTRFSARFSHDRVCIAEDSLGALIEMPRMQRLLWIKAEAKKYGIGYPCVSKEKDQHMYFNYDIPMRFAKHHIRQTEDHQFYAGNKQHISAAQMSDILTEYVLKYGELQEVDEVTPVLSYFLEDRSPIPTLTILEAVNDHVQERVKKFNHACLEEKSIGAVTKFNTDRALTLAIAKDQVPLVHELLTDESFSFALEPYHFTVAYEIGKGAVLEYFWKEKKEGLERHVFDLCESHQVHEFPLLTQHVIRHCSEYLVDCVSSGAPERALKQLLTLITPADRCKQALGKAANESLLTVLAEDQRCDPSEELVRVSLPSFPEDDVVKRIHPDTDNLLRALIGNRNVDIVRLAYRIMRDAFPKMEDTNDSVFEVIKGIDTEHPYGPYRMILEITKYKAMGHPDAMLASMLPESIDYISAWSPKKAALDMEKTQRIAARFASLITVKMSEIPWFDRIVSLVVDTGCSLSQTLGLRSKKTGHRRSPSAAEPGKRADADRLRPAPGKRAESAKNQPVVIFNRPLRSIDHQE